MSENWLAVYQGDKPKQAKLSATADGIELRLASRPAYRDLLSSDAAWLGGLGMIGLGLGFAANMLAVAAGIDIASLPTIFAIIFVAVVWTPLRARRRARSMLTCDGRTLRTGRVQLPLDSITDIEIVASDFNGCIRVVTETDSYLIADGLYPGELDWTARLLRDLVARCRARLTTDDEREALAARHAAQKLLER